MVYFCFVLGGVCLAPFGSRGERERRAGETLVFTAADRLMMICWSFSFSFYFSFFFSWRLKIEKWLCLGISHFHAPETSNQDPESLMPPPPPLSLSLSSSCLACCNGCNYCVCVCCSQRCWLPTGSPSTIQPLRCVTIVVDVVASSRWESFSRVMNVWLYDPPNIRSAAMTDRSQHAHAIRPDFSTLAVFLRRSSLQSLLSLALPNGNNHNKQNK
jgi:hypothetical protein